MMWRPGARRFSRWALCALLWGLAPFFSLSADPASPESLDKLRQNLLEARALLATWGQSLNVREAELNEKQSFLDEIERRLNEREASLLENEAALNARGASLDERESSLRERERILSENEADYQASERLISDLKTSLKTASESLTGVQARAVALETERNFWRIGGIAGWAVAIIAIVFASLK